MTLFAPTFTQGYSWDTWVTLRYSTSTYHSYSQWVPPEAYTKGSFDYHNKAIIRHRTSADGIRWQDQGNIKINYGKYDFDHLAFWSGSVVIRKEKFYMFYTRAVNELADAMGEQRIHLATSLDGHNYTFQKEVFNPLRIQNRKFDDITYTFEATVTSEGELIPALRDPQITDVESLGLSHRWMMLFSANTKNNKGEVLHSIGRAGSDNLSSWKLMPPLLLPIKNPEIQLELPNLTMLNGANGVPVYLLMVSVREQGKPGVLFFSSEQLNKDWVSVEVSNPEKLQGKYGFNFVKGESEELGLIYFNDKGVKVGHSFIGFKFIGNKIVFL